MIPVSKIKETCLYVADLHKTKEFYNEKIGLPLISLVENSHVFFRAGTSVLLCFLSERSSEQTSLPKHYGKGHIHFAFEVESHLSSETEKLKAPSMSPKVLGLTSADLPRSYRTPPFSLGLCHGRRRQPLEGL